MPRKEGPIPGHNFLGQRRKPRRLKKPEIEAMVNTIESAMNDGRYTEARVYWNDTGVWCAPVEVKRGTRVGDPSG